MPPPNPTITARTTRFPELDGVRGLAILLVVSVHYISNNILSIEGVALAPWQNRLMRTFWLGWIGVDLFFVLSGFLITRILLINRESPSLFRVFFIRRICRILPLTFLAIGLVMAIKALLPQGASWDWLFENQHPLVSYLTFTQNIFMGLSGKFGGAALAATWSLAVEEQFYLLMPFVICFCPRRILPWVFLVTMPMAWLARMHFHDLRGNVWLPGRCDALMMGCLIAWLHGEEPIRKALSKSWAGLHILGGSLAVGLLYINQMPNYFGVSIQSWTTCLWGTMVTILVFCPRGPLGAVFRMRWLGSLGTISFGVYLFHFPIMGLLFHFIRGTAPSLKTADDLWLLPLAFLLTLLLSITSYFAFERPLLRLGHRFRY